MLRISFTRPLSTGKFFGSEAGFRISVNYSFTPKVESGCKSDDNVEILIHLKILLDKGFIANTRDVTKNLTNFLSEENSVFLYD